MLQSKGSFAPPSAGGMAWTRLQFTFAKASKAAGSLEKTRQKNINKDAEKKSNCSFSVNLDQGLYGSHPPTPTLTPSCQNQPSELHSQLSGDVKSWHSS